MIRKIRRTRQVRDDIIAIFIYLHSKSPQAAENVFDAIEQTIRSLARFPGVGNRWISAHHSLEGLRYTTVRRYRNYLVFFRAERSVVRVYRVVHATRDLSRVVDEIAP